MRFQRYAWGLLAYNLVVILGGAFVRASVSGDGCGNHWPTCHGELLPVNGQLKTLIEFSHRLSTGVLLVLVLGLVAWAFRVFPKGHLCRRGAVGVLVFTLIEAGIGAGLVLFQLVARDTSVSRAIVMPAHLVTTFMLLGSATLTAWWAGGGGVPRLRGQGPVAWVLGLGLLATLLLGVSGAITALGDTLFPARSLAEGLREDLAPSAHFLVSLRIYHPLIAVSTGFFLALLAVLCTRWRPAPQVDALARMTLSVFGVQMGVGLMNLALLAPVWMQLVHLLLADLFWISLVLLAAAVLAEPLPHVGGDLAPAGDPCGAEAAGAPAAVRGGRRGLVREYVALTKPRVISLLLLTTLAAMAIAAGSGPAPGIGLYLAVAVGFYMAAGAANTINMLLERDLDLQMGRTATRPTVTRSIAPAAAVRFALVMTVGSFLLLWGAANLLCAMLAMAGLVFYITIYTLLLKRRTWLNIVIGGAAGAFPPLVGWAAVTGGLSPLAWCLFGIIFLWTPVHFWALAILLKEDYARAGVPMLPVVRGERATVTQILQYAVLTAAFSALPAALRQDGQAAVGWIYLGAAVLLNGVLLARSLALYRQPDHQRARTLFKYSMLYLALLFLAMAVDRAVSL